MQPIVLGHSLGGFVAQVYAIRHPGDASAIVLQSTCARFDLERLVAELRRLAGDEVAETGRRVYGRTGEPVSDEDWRRCWRAFGPWVPRDEEKARTIRNGRLNEVGLPLVTSFDVVAQLGGVEVPTLVCTGDLDPITGPVLAEVIVAALPDGVARLEIIPGAGHFPWRDRPDLYWPVLVGFVRDVALQVSRA